MIASDCLFCNIGRHKVPATIIVETNDAIAFDDIHPKAPVHTLLIAKNHERTDIDWMGLAHRVALKKGIAATGYRLITNQGGHAGQEIDHPHMHILGGKPLGPMIQE